MAYKMCSEVPHSKDEPFYKTIREYALKAIKRIEKFTKGDKFEASDLILLQIRLEMLEENFKEFVYYNYIVLGISKTELDITEEVEELYVSIKAKIQFRLEFLCAVENKDTDLQRGRMPTNTAFPNTKDITKELYNSIVDSMYTHALEVTMDISTSSSSHVITDVVKKLCEEGNSNVMSYVYQLWSTGKNDVVSALMPVFSLIFGEQHVVLHNKKYGLALKLDANTDRDNDRHAWGDSKDKTSQRVVWKMIPFWENNKVLFKIKNIDCDMYLKLAVAPDGIGDRGAYGSSGHAGSKHDWRLEPIFVGDELIFFIVNQAFNQALKLAVALDSYNDRLLWGHNGTFRDDPNRFGWYIKPLASCSHPDSNLT